MSDQPHSAPYLTDIRDLWWHDDYLELLARRLGMANVRSLLDVGCGLGHWGRRWLPHLAAGATILGVDRERRWVEKTSYPAIVGDATALPFADGTFDAATCQTLLMHLAEPERALAELVRVVKPGGLVFVSEPNNLFNSIFFSDATRTRPVEDLLLEFELWARVQRGKLALGLGDALVGERLPAMLAALGLTDVRAWQSDRATPFVAPYGPHERAILDVWEEHRLKGVGGWDEAEMRRRFVAGGGDEATFARLFASRHANAAEDEARVRAGTFSTGGSGILILAAGRKPTA